MTDAGAHAIGTGRRILILCADDYGMNEGITRAVLDLARPGRISATSAMTTFDRWPEDARRLLEVRDRISIGLHINLTEGAPLGPMPALAPRGRLPELGLLVRSALAGRLDAAEIEAEVTRQLERFESETGFPPDHVDGHQHVHALPRVRRAVLSALAKRFPRGGPLLRDPAHWASAARTRGAVGKALVIAGLSAGFRAAARSRNFATNDSFAGVSSFDRDRPYAAELSAALRLGARRHLVMCHPGYTDAACAGADPIAARRGDELAAILEQKGLVQALWRPSRLASGPAVTWQAE